MNNLTNFDFNGNQVRVINLNGEYWFVGKDIASILEYADPKQAIRQHCDFEDTLTDIELTKKARELTRSNFHPVSRAIYINEAGLYSLVLGSHKPEAKIFKRWVTSEVLPSIRKTGKYEVTPQPQLSPYLIRLEHFNATRKYIPKGYWCVFGETANLLKQVSELYPVGVYDLVDGSVGKRWALYRNDKEWQEPRLQYPHHFPDQRWVKDAWCYSFKELPFFREWFQDIYEPNHLPEYLQKKYGEIAKI